jgi:hypothetical protein
MADQWGLLPQVRFHIGTVFFYFITWVIVYSYTLAGKHLRLFSLVFPCKVCKYSFVFVVELTFGFLLQGIMQLCAAREVALTLGP